MGGAYHQRILRLTIPTAIPLGTIFKTKQTYHIPLPIPPVRYATILMANTVVPLSDTPPLLHRTRIVITGGRP